MANTTKEFIVVKIPDITLQYTNYAYLPLNSSIKAKYIKLITLNKEKSIVYLTSFRNELSSGTIALNACQRDDLGIKVSDKILAMSYDAATQLSAIDQMTMEIRLFNADEKNNVLINVKMILESITCLKDHVLTVGQNLPALIEDKMITMKIVKLLYQETKIFSGIVKIDTKTNLTPIGKLKIIDKNNNFSPITKINLTIEYRKNADLIIDQEDLVENIKNLTNEYWQGKINDMQYNTKRIEIVVKNIECKTEFGFIADDTIIECAANNPKVKIIDKNSKKQLFKGEFDLTDLGIGGLDHEFKTIFRRAFNSRAIPKKLADAMGIKHIKGILLFGPPGTGKTLLARQIGKILNCPEPKIVNGPELLNKFVGESERQVRELFADAEADVYGENLYLIICDEFDAIGGKRAASSDSTGVSKNIVNTLLAKIDGVKSLDNILLICMTNRIDMIDEALLRPGRLEIQIEIKLPDEKGRTEILKIHTSKLTKNKFLDASVDLVELAKHTKNFTGAELEGLVKSASSFALAREIDISKNQVQADEKINPIVDMQDFKVALSEVKPMFGVSNELELFTNTKLLFWHHDIENIYHDILNKFKNNRGGNIQSFLLTANSKTGKTKLASHIAKESNIECIKYILPSHLSGLTETARCNYIKYIFESAIKSKNSIIILDNFERLIEWAPIGPRFNNTVYQALMDLIRQPIDKTNRLFVLITGYKKEIFDNLECFDLIDYHYDLPYYVTDKEIIFFEKEFGVKFELGTINNIFNQQATLEL